MLSIGRRPIDASSTHASLMRWRHSCRACSRRFEAEVASSCSLILPDPFNWNIVRRRHPQHKSAIGFLYPRVDMRRDQRRATPENEFMIHFVVSTVAHLNSSNQDIIPTSFQKRNTQSAGLDLSIEPNGQPTRAQIPRRNPDRVKGGAISTFRYPRHLNRGRPSVAHRTRRFRRNRRLLNRFTHVHSLTARSKIGRVAHRI